MYGSTTSHPKWFNCERMKPELEGVYMVRWSNDDIEPAWWVMYGEKGVFQRKCGTEERCEGWDGDVGFVVEWCHIHIPQ